MTPPNGYEVLADKRFHSSHLGLVGACTTARSEAMRHARDRLDVSFVVQRGGIIHATYQVRAGKLTAWVR